MKAVNFKARGAGVKNKYRGKSAGYTLIELLTVIAIMAVLVAITIPMAAPYRPILELRSLDKVAREIFMSAQNRAAQLRTSGGLKEIVINAVDDGKAVKSNTSDFVMLNSTNALELGLLTDRIAKKTLNYDVQYEIKYEPDGTTPSTVSVAGVYLSRNLPDAATLFTKNDDDLEFKNRLADELGYYGVLSSVLTDDAPGTITLRKPVVDITNNDELKVSVSFMSPVDTINNYTDDTEAKNKIVPIKIEAKIFSGNVEVSKNGSVIVKDETGKYIENTASVLLWADTAYWNPKESDLNDAISVLTPLSETPVVEGSNPLVRIISAPTVIKSEYVPSEAEPIGKTATLEYDFTKLKFPFNQNGKFTFWVKIHPNYLEDSNLDNGVINNANAYTTAKGNGLFDGISAKGDTIYVSCYRHLKRLAEYRNLKEGLPENWINKVVQLKDITCQEYKNPDKPEEGYIYGNFEPITGLTYYDGKNYYISKFNASGGLFDNIENSNTGDGNSSIFKNLTVKDAAFEGETENRGILAASVKGNVVFENIKADNVKVEGGQNSGAIVGLASDVSLEGGKICTPVFKGVTVNNSQITANEGETIVNAGGVCGSSSGVTFGAEDVPTGDQTIFNGVSVTNTSVNSNGGNAGGITGSSNKDTFTNCKVYLTPNVSAVLSNPATASLEDNMDAAAAAAVKAFATEYTAEQPAVPAALDDGIMPLMATPSVSKYAYQITGNNAGGLAGLVTGGTKADPVNNKPANPVKITKSFVATLVGGESASGEAVENSSVGGLIGSISGVVDIDKSYADCYISGANAGGIAGACIGDSMLNVSDAYSAGFIEMLSTTGTEGFSITSKAAGICPAGTVNASYFYSAMGYVYSYGDQTVTLHPEIFKADSSAETTMLGSDALSYAETLIYPSVALADNALKDAMKSAELNNIYALAPSIDGSAGDKNGTAYYLSYQKTLEEMFTTVEGVKPTDFDKELSAHAISSYTLLNIKPSWWTDGTGGTFKNAVDSLTETAPDGGTPGKTVFAYIETLNADIDANPKTVWSHPYNFAGGIGFTFYRTEYPYPIIKDMPQYGDWWLPNGLVLSPETPKWEADSEGVFTASLKCGLLPGAPIDDKVESTLTVSVNTGDAKFDNLNEGPITFKQPDKDGRKAEYYAFNVNLNNNALPVGVYDILVTASHKISNPDGSVFDSEVHNYNSSKDIDVSFLIPSDIPNFTIKTKQVIGLDGNPTMEKYAQCNLNLPNVDVLSGGNWIITPWPVTDGEPSALNVVDVNTSGVLTINQTVLNTLTAPCNLALTCVMPAGKTYYYKYLIPLNSTTPASLSLTEPIFPAGQPILTPPLTVQPPIESIPQPTTMPTPGPTPAPTTAPTPEPTLQPTANPKPTAQPTLEPTPEPTAQQTVTPEPTTAPVTQPTPAYTPEPATEPAPEPSGTMAPEPNPQTSADTPQASGDNIGTIS